MHNEKNNSAESILDELSLLVVDLSPTDLQEIAKIHEGFKQMNDLTDLNPKIKSDIKNYMEVAEKIIMEECSFEEGIHTIKDAIQSLQQSLQQGESDDESGVDINVHETATVIDADILRQFLEKQPSQLEEFEEVILKLDNGDTDSEKDIRRYLHTWKGESGMLGLTVLQEFFHNVENYLENMNVENDKNFVDGLFAVKDLFAAYCESLKSDVNAHVDINKMEEIYSLLKYEVENNTEVSSASTVEDKTEEIKQEEKNDDSQKPEVEIPAIDLSGDTSLMLDFITESNEHLQNAEVQLMNLESNSEDSESLNAIFRAFHTIKGVSSFIGLFDVKELSHKAETMLDNVRKGKIELQDFHIDIAFESIDMLKQMVDSLKNALEGAEYITPDGYVELLKKIENPDSHMSKIPKQTSADKKVGEILVEEGKITSESIDKAIQSQKKGNNIPLGEILVKEGVAKPKEVAEAIRTQKVSQKKKDESKIGAVDQTVKVSTRRLDSLIDMVGELVIANSMVAQEKEIKESINQRLTKNVSHLCKIVRELQEHSMSLRMVSVKTTFQKMARLVRDLSKKNDKLVTFEMSGEDTELDRNVVEEIGDPLIHMVRNAVDHGVENPDERKKNGKPEYGTVQLNAYHKGGNVVIEITDDGKGLDKDRILEKAVKMGVIKESDNLSDYEIYNLIFHPGLSTARKVTDVSGRGVGMDVVRKNIEALRGHVDIKSEPGKGSTISLMLPLTLAIIDGMIVRVGGENYIVPTISVVESLRPSSEQIKTVVGKGEVIDLRGELLPIYHLDKLFKIPDAVQNPQEGLVIVINGSNDSKPRGFVVDELIGQQQVVIKSISKGVGELTGISGGAILGDGKVSLILDPTGVIKVAETSNNGLN